MCALRCNWIIVDLAIHMSSQILDLQPHFWYPDRKHEYIAQLWTLANEHLIPVILPVLETWFWRVAVIVLHDAILVLGELSRF